jgi:gamma-glutamyltranspeptidase / glutathione hydrolase
VGIEAKKLAYADMLQYVTDPRFSDVPVKGILSKDYAARRARLIDMRKAQANVPAGPVLEIGNDTTYLCVVDREGNMVSLIQSNYSAFGCGLVPDGTGFVLQDRGSSFSMDSSHPNVVAGRKRPLHTIIPGFMEKDDVRIAFGIMGGPNQPQAHAQFVSNIVDHGMNIQAALEAARFTKRNVEGYDVQLENRVPTEARTELERRGHVIKLIASFGGAVGGGQAVMRDYAKAVNFGASDPRKDGAAVPEPYPK